MPHILGEIGFEPGDLLHHSTLEKWFDRIQTALWRVRPHLSVQLYETSGHAAIAVIVFRQRNRQQTLLSADELPCLDAQNNCSRRYRYANNSGRSLYDRETPRHTPMLAGRPRNVCDLTSLAADKGYDRMELREQFGQEVVRPLIKHRGFRPIDYAQNARDEPPYCQRTMCNTVFSTIKRTFGDVMRARTW